MQATVPPAQRLLGGLWDAWEWLAADQAAGDKSSRRLAWAFYAGLLLIGGLVAVAAPHRAHRWAVDTFLYLDGGWRVFNGQRPYVDFYTGLGPVTFQLVALGFWLGGATAAGIDYGFGLAAMMLGVWAWLLFQRRMERPSAMLLAWFVAALSIAPHALGARLDILTYASLYNRLGYALTAIVLVECICAPLGLRSRDSVLSRSRLLTRAAPIRAATARERYAATAECHAAGDLEASSKDEWAGGISSGAACLVLLFLKPSFFVIAVAALGASYIFRDLRRLRRTLGMAAGFAIPAVLMLAYLRFDVGAIWYDFRNVAAARTHMASADPSFDIGKRVALKHAYENAAELLGLLLLGWMVAILPRARRAAKYLDAWWPLAAASAVFAADVALNTANGVQYCLPLIGVASMVLVSVVYRWWRSADVAERGEYRWLCGFSLVLGMALYAPQALNDFATLLYSAQQSVLGPPLAAHFEAPPLRRLLSRETPRDWDEPYNGKYLVDSINDGVALLGSASRPAERVMTLNPSDPFSFALQRRPPEGGSPILGASFLSPGHMPPLEWMIGGADLVMEPKSPSKDAVWAKQVFGEYIDRNYELAGESKEWLLYRRKAEAK